MLSWCRSEILTRRVREGVSKCLSRAVEVRFATSFDLTIDHRQVKMLNIIDEFTCEALAIRVDHSIVAGLA